MVGAQAGRVGLGLGKQGVQAPVQLGPVAVEAAAEQPVADVGHPGAGRERPDVGRPALGHPGDQLLGTPRGGWRVPADGDGHGPVGVGRSAEQPAHGRVGPVGPDHHPGGQLAVDHHQAVALLKAADPRPPVAGSGGQRRLDQAGVEHRPRHHVVRPGGIAGHLQPSRGAQPQPADRRVPRQHPSGPHGGQLVDGVRAEAIAADLVPREGRLVDQQHRGVRSQPPGLQRRRRPGRSSANDHQVPDRGHGRS